MCAFYIFIYFFIQILKYYTEKQVKINVCVTICTKILGWAINKHESWAKNNCAVPGDKAALSVSDYLSVQKCKYISVHIVQLREKHWNVLNFSTFLTLKCKPILAEIYSISPPAHTKRWPEFSLRLKGVDLCVLFCAVFVLSYIASCLSL